LTARDATAAAWKDVQNPQWQARRMQIYAAMVDRLDQNIGRIFTKLRETGQEDNTLVLFMSDNGGCAEEIRSGWTGLHIPKMTRDGRPVRVGNNPAVMPGTEDTYESYGLPWANASNTPFRLYKHWVHEGGISTPLIARWPARLAASKNLIAEPTHFIDIMATCVDAGAAAYPTRAGGQTIIPMQGRSLLPLMTGKEKRFGRQLFWEHEGNRAMRHESWKLVRKYPGDWELYDMNGDRTELHDLGPSHKKLLGEMASTWQKWADAAGVLPWEEVSKKLVNR
jgi:arylsulfatase A-like enzyme